MCLIREVQCHIFKYETLYKCISLWCTLLLFLTTESLFSSWNLEAGEFHKNECPEFSHFVRCTGILWVKAQFHPSFHLCINRYNPASLNNIGCFFFACFLSLFTLLLGCFLISSSFCAVARYIISCGALAPGRCVSLFPGVSGHRRLLASLYFQTGNDAIQGSAKHHCLAYIWLHFAITKGRDLPTTTPLWWHLFINKRWYC